MVPFIILLLVDLYILWSMRAEVAAPPTSGEADYVVYGNMGCGWTRKQLDVMKEKKLSYEFVDCGNGECPADVKAYPTLKHPDGNITTGFNTLGES